MLKIIRVVIFTLSMYLVTHLFVFVTLPFAILVSYFDKEKIPSIKHWFVKSLFAIVGREIKISGLDKIDPNHSYVIVSNYPSFYAGLSLMGAFPRASIVAHAFVKRIPLLGQVLSRMGTIFVQPGMTKNGKIVGDFQFGKFDSAQSVIILPEGARTPDGKISSLQERFYIYYEANIS